MAPEVGDPVVLIGRNVRGPVFAKVTKVGRKYFTTDRDRRARFFLDTWRQEGQWQHWEAMTPDAHEQREARCVAETELARLGINIKWGPDGARARERLPAILAAVRAVLS